jgi:hypothetical protein
LAQTFSGSSINKCIFARPRQALIGMQMFTIFRGEKPINPLPQGSFLLYFAHLMKV